MKRNWDDAFSPTPAVFHDRMTHTLASIEEGQSMKKRYKVSTLLVAAIVIMMLAGGAAIAAANGVFDWLANKYNSEIDRERFSKVNELADSVAQSRTTADGAITVELNQSYFNGSELFIGYKTYGNASRTDADLKLDAELIARIKRDGINVEDLTDVYIPDNATQKAYDALVRREFSGEDYGCVAHYDSYLSDHTYITLDGVEYDIMDDYRDSEDKDGVTTGYREYHDNLNSDGGDGFAALAIGDDVDEIDYSFKVQHGVWYYYKDATGTYTMSEKNAEPEKLEFTVLREAGLTAEHSAEFARKDFNAAVKVEASDVSTRITVSVTYVAGGKGDFGDDWDSADELKAQGKDVLGGFTALIDGTSYDGNRSIRTIEENGQSIEETEIVLQPLPEGTKEITLVPCWSIGGEDMDEAMTIELD